MNNFNDLSANDLSLVNGGVDKIDIIISIGGMFYPPLGALGAIKTVGDWLYEQDW